MKRRETKRVTSSVKSPISVLPLDELLLQDLLTNNRLRDLEVSIYGDRKGLEEQAIKKHIRKLGLRPQLKESTEQRHVIVKLKKHLKFVVLKIESKIEVEQ
ncbi:hypothetical protein NEHOM01_0092 [Nematocida homosporus]|uniref:uncharacterized protein n=1 Tax=Nematocida homosporus TaxID=1912981 RepID=UPI00221F8F43|nr:uncharacterized protein NEHOM01_0092 [Nematocida homosporus]KAI5184347.1 hypothetical protein NEHOM01_0092 [Nematocida homosporus]